MRGIKLVVLLMTITSVAMVSQVGSAQAEIMYAVGMGLEGFPANSPVYTIDTTTQVPTLVGMSGIGRLNSLAATPAGELYSVGGPTQFDQNHLVTINPVTGVGTDLGNLSFDIAPSVSGGITGLAADASGNLYGTFVGSAQGMTRALLYRINPSTLVATQISADMGTNGAPLQSLDFSPTGTLYGMDLNALYTINTTTGAATLVGPGNARPVQSIAFAPDGTLWAVDGGNPGFPSRFFTVDLLTGNKTEMFRGSAGSVLDLRGIEFFQPVPVPAAVWLFGSGIAAMAGFARRKTHDMSA